jgi:hypothetical protein
MRSPPPQVRFLHDVLGVHGAADHPVDYREQQWSVPFAEPRLGR